MHDLEKLSPEEKRQKVKDALFQIMSINRQKEMLANELAGYFQLLKTLGYSRSIIGKYLKEKTKPPFQIETEELLLKELDSIMRE